jgi:hypothetical protein
MLATRFVQLILLHFVTIIIIIIQIPKLLIVQQMKAVSFLSVVESYVLLNLSNPPVCLTHRVYLKVQFFPHRKDVF